MFRKIARNTHFNRANFFFLGILIVLVIAACQGAESTPPRDVSGSDIQVSITGPTLEPYQFKTSDKGTAAVHGKILVLDPMSLVPAPDDAVYLVPLPDASITTIPEFESGTVPQAEVDEASGEFMFTNLQPGQFAIVVVTKGGAQIPARFYQENNYAIFKIEESQLDTIIELGNLSLP
jgi:hypothetical protein